MISVVVPVYNVENYIVKCLESIVNQDYKDFELLVVNDGSKDNGIKYAEEYLKSTDVNYRIINKENGGLASARNAGIRQAKGDYIAFVDSDDVISKEFLSLLLEQINISGADFSFCDFRFIKKQELPDDDNQKIKVYFKKRLLNSFLKRDITFVVPSMLFRKQFIIDNDLFFNENLKFSEDQPFIWNVILHSNESVYLYKKMYGYVIREDSIMNSSSYEKISNSHLEYKEYTTNLFNQFPEYKEITDKALPRWQLGSLYTAAKLVNYNDYKKLYLQMDGKTILHRLKGINESKATLLALIAKISPKLLYAFCRKLNLNG